MGKIYTKTGDGGMTSLIGGKRVPKSSLLVDIYGSIDELSSFIGVFYDTLADQDSERDLLRSIQKVLLRVESYYASEMDVKYDVTTEDINLLENYIDSSSVRIRLIDGFVIPGGDISSSLAHVCRTVCRRCERLASLLDTTSFSFKYLNRLSDFFYVIACQKR